MPGTHGTGNREIKGVIFDMDNTLFDFIEAKLSACNAIVDSLGAGDPEDIFGYFLSGVHDFEDWRNIEDYLKDNEIYSKEMFYNCCTIYEDIKLQSIQAYPGVEETLSTLQDMGLALAIVTDAHTKNATQRLQKLHLLDSFDALLITDIAGAKKPAPEIFYHALNTLELLPEQTIFVGDSLRRDIEPAQKIGMITAHAAYGDRNFFEDRTWRSNHVLNSISDVIVLAQYDEMIQKVPVNNCAMGLM